MTFSIFLPDPPSRMSPPPAVLYYLAGLTCCDEHGRTKSGFHEYAAKHYLAVVFPDTSPRGDDIESVKEDWDFGEGAGFYLNATESKFKKNYNMATYLTKELPTFINGLFYVDPKRQGITGHSMGGHGSLVTHLRNPGMF